MYPKAFCQWVKRESKDDIDTAAKILKWTLQSNPKEDNCIWDILKDTGETLYNDKTFVKAARNVLNSVKE